MDRSASSDSGQAVPFFLALAVAVMASAAVALGVARAALELDRRQAIADVAALAGARALRDGAGAEAAATTAELVARNNGMRASANAPATRASWDGRMRVVVTEPLHIGFGRLSIEVGASRSAEAMVAAPIGMTVDPGPGDYPGPFAWRQGQAMRPDVATAFDRLAGAASMAGVHLSIVSAWRSSTEQARLFAAHPDPKWVARPGTSLHRLGTELDLGPASAYGWLDANAGQFGFLRRYPWEPWHFGYIRGPGSASVGFGGRWRAGSRSSRTGAGAGGDSSGRGGGLDSGRRGSGALQPWVPVRYAQTILRASVRHGVSAAVLAAQLRAESDFNPRTVSPAGAQGIAQLMPDESRRFRVNPFRPAEAIDAQASLMRELLARFGSVPLALAAYNAGPNAVARCGCVPPYRETRAYVSKIIGWISGAGGATGPAVVLVA